MEGNKKCFHAKFSRDFLSDLVLQLCHCECSQFEISYFFPVKATLREFPRKENFHFVFVKIFW